MMNQEIFDKQAKELASVDVMQLAMPPDKGYMLAAVVQAAVICLDLPETTQNLGREFVQAFCDRYRDQMPTVIQSIDDAWEDPNLMTEDEFEESLGKRWERIARDVEEEMGGEVKIIIDKPHQGALCPVNGKPCSKESNFYYYPNDCPDWVMCEEIADDEEEDGVFESIFSVGSANAPHDYDY